MKELDPDKVARLKEAAFYGMNKTAMARYAGVHRATLDNWLKAHPEVNEEILNKRGDGDLEVAKALHEEAVKGRNSTLLAHLSTKRLKNSEFNNDWDDALDKEEPTIQVVLSESDIDARIAELKKESEESGDGKH